MDRIHRLLEITERERHHELLLSVKNLQDLGASSFLYIVHVLPRPLPSEVVKGEHFVLANLLKSFLECSSQVEAVPRPLIRLDYSPLVVQDSKPTPQEANKKKRKSEQVKTASEGLEGFVGWTNPTVGELSEEKEAEMSGLVAGFAMRMSKRAAANTQEEAIPSLEV